MNKNTYAKQRPLKTSIFHFYRFAFFILLLLGIGNFARAQDDSQLFMTGIQPSMVEGDIYRFQIGYRNTGTTTWSAGQGYVLASPQNNWDAGPISIKPGEPIPPGREFSTYVTVTAPPCCNTRLDWQMRKGRQEWFGSTAFWEKDNYSTGTFIQITRKPQIPNRASFHSQNVPLQMVGGQTYTISVTMKNTGTATWNEAGQYHLGLQNSANPTVWGVSRVPVKGSVAPGRLHTFTFDITAPSTPGTHKIIWKMLQTGVEWFGSSSWTLDIDVSPPEPNSASFVSQSVPVNMVRGRQYAASVTMKNTGSQIWSEGAQYRLGSQNPQDNANWGLGRVQLTESVAPGQSYTFSFPINAPAALGIHYFQWQMVQDGVEWFGSKSTSLAIDVADPVPNDAEFVSQTIPENMVAGQPYLASVTMVNTGTATWSEGDGYRLGSQAPQDNALWGPSRIFIAKPVLPGEQYTFSFPIMAPMPVGTFSFQWQMVQDGVQWFGSKSDELQIPLLAPVPNSAAFVSQSVPEKMAAGQQYSASVTMKNTGTATWAEADAFRLGSQSAQDDIWGVSRVSPTNSVAPGEQYTFNFQITAPATPNTYGFQWQMVQGDAAWFGGKSDNREIVVAAPAGSNSAIFVAQNVPGSMIAGESHQALVTMRNTGTTTWTSGNGYQLRAQNPADNNIWNAGPIALNGTVPPGLEYTFSFPITAPTEPASYNFQWQMAQGTQWFGAASTNTVVPVLESTGDDGADFVSQSLPATTMTTGQSYTVSVTMKNTGSSTWSAGDTYHLGAQNPQDPVNTTWTGTGRVSLDTPVAPGEEHSFSFPVTAPANPGTYNFQWKMLRGDAAWFGAQTTNIAVPVVAATITETITFFHNDVSGSPMLATDASGNLLWNESYLPYGERLNDIDGSDNALWFTGKPHDSDTGLSYMGARYYNPALGRFMAMDPKGFDVDNLHSFNRYAYANNNPFKFVDPDGRSPVLVTRAVFLASFEAATAFGAAKLGFWLADKAWNVMHNDSSSSPSSTGSDQPKINSGLKTPEEIAGNGVNAGTDRKGNKNVARPGGAAGAREDYDSMGPTKGRDIVGPNGEQGETGKLPDGRSVTYRPWSSDVSDNVPTVQVGPAPGYKFRYP
ncbi:MAG: NBR1-Ig-like domain-containing protein [Comamonas sp.]